MATQSADQTLDAAVERGDVPGVVALAATRDGIISAHAAGYRALGSSAEMTLDTVFNIASMTKAITAVAALQLVEQGRWSLHEPLPSEALHQLQVLDGFDPNGTPQFRPPKRPITLRHLLTHTSGLGYALWCADLHQYEKTQTQKVDLYDWPLVFDPGDRWLYGTSIDWLGRLIEELTSTSLENYFRETILDPLAMADTSYNLPPAQRHRLATLHQRDPEGVLHAVDTNPPEKPARYVGGGGMFSTGPDYIKFLRMLLNSGELDGVRLLAKESVEELERNHIDDLDVDPMPSNAADKSNRVDFYPGMPKKWSLGGLLNTQASPGGRAAQSWAWGGMFNTYFWLDPTNGVAGLIMTQILPFCDRPALELFEAFEKSVYSSL
jgi:CubicO group peptidase (beta-lactamase class C family)